MQRFAKLAALGAIGVSLGALVLFGLIAFISRPTPTGGTDRTSAIITWISVAVPIAAIVAAHLAYARILLREARRER